MISFHWPTMMISLSDEPYLNSQSFCIFHFSRFMGGDNKRNNHCMLDVLNNDIVSNGHCHWACSKGGK